eukprot:COSAG06_NODE_18748_length_870_cov_42.695201_1_plen_289_part_11
MEHLEVGVPSTRQESSSSTSYELRCVATVHANGAASDEQQLRWSRWRRYSEFFELRAVLTEAFGDELGLLPAFPGKSLLSTASLIESRREQLQVYMQALVRVPLVREFERFLRFLGAPAVEPQPEPARRARLEPEPEQARAPNGVPVISMPLEPATPPRVQQARAPAVLNKTVEPGTSFRGGGPLAPPVPSSPDASQTKALLRAFYAVHEPAFANDEKLESLMRTYQRKAAQAGDVSVGGWRSLLFGSIAKESGVHPLEHWQEELDSTDGANRSTPRRVKFSGDEPEPE